MKTFFTDIPNSNKWKILQKITEGWSHDEKYHIQTEGSTQFLLRISDGISLEKEKAHYKALTELNSKNVRVSKLIEEGVCNGGKNTFRLFSWIEGVEVNKALNSFSEKEQYDFGVEAGTILKEIHQINAPVNHTDWATHYNKKINTKIEQYQNCGLNLEHADKILAYIEEHRNLLKERPICFHHGDFHIGNMLITPKKELAVIDFNRLDFGDPWEEFNRTNWSASESPWFASGQINGYFENDVPVDFFELMALYMGVNQLGAIPWAIPYGEKQIEILLAQTKEVLEWYENFNQVIPKWYIDFF
ncbi:MAG: aminoglycoside phosphotransferase family protein [Chitinophagales bacterium]